MGISNEVPFLPESYVEKLDQGWALGQEFVDSRTGYKYRLFQLHTAGLGSVGPADKSTAIFQADHVVSDKASIGVDTTYPQVAGVFGEPTKGWTTVPPWSVTGTTRYLLVLVQGEKQISTGAGSGIVAGDAVICDSTDGNWGKRLDHTSNSFTRVNDYVGGYIGRARGSEAGQLVNVGVYVKR